MPSPKMNQILRVAGVATLAFAFAVVASQASGQPRSDTVLTTEVNEAVEEAGVSGVRAVVRDGVALLTGEVEDGAEQARAVEAALFVDGVVAVETDLTVVNPEPDPSRENEEEEKEEPGDDVSTDEAPVAGDADLGDVPSAVGEFRDESGVESGDAPPTEELRIARTPIRTVARARPDDAIRADVVAALARADLDGGPPQVAVEDGIVRLVGQVPHAWARSEVLDLAREIEGVAAVDPDLEVAEPESQDELVEDLRSAVLRYPYYTVFDDINFGVQERNTVILLGAVTEPFKKTEIGRRVAQVFGVREVDNRIEVLPLSPNDQDLRRALFYRIYRDPRFSDRASTTDPPIHIIVSRGVVVLAGVVRSQIESRVAESIARSTPGVFRVVNRLRH